MKAGYRLFDGASDYGNEKEAGEGVKRALSDGLVKREDLCECFFMGVCEHELIMGSHYHQSMTCYIRQTLPDRYSQLWNTNHAPTNVKSFAKYQLQLWGLDKFDLYLMHFPISLKYVPAEIKFPAEWEHPDGGVQLGTLADISSI